MKKVSELTGVELDYWVAKAQGIIKPELLENYSPSSNWADGGPIIEREAGTFAIANNDQNFEQAFYWAEMGKTITRRYRMSGPTHLIAAMRAFVASRFGEEVDDSQTHRV